MKVFPFVLILIMLACNSSSDSTPPSDNPSGTIDQTSPNWLNFRGAQGPGLGKRIVLISGDEEYRSEEALPQLGKILANQHGFECTVLFAQDPEKPGIVDPNYRKNIPGLQSLKNADLVILFTRFRELPDDQMQHISNYLKEGNPIIAIRTATHAFMFQDTTSQWKNWGNNYNDDQSNWNGGFGRLVLGEKWYTHHGHHKHQSTRGIIAPGQSAHPILKGIENGEIWGPSDVYGVRLPLPGDATPIVLGQVIDRLGEYDESDPYFGMKPEDQVVATENAASKQKYNPNDPMMPIAWTKSYQLPDGTGGTSFTSTIGAATDMANEGVRRMFVNACYHLLGMEVPGKASVDFEGEYKPSAFSFKDDEYWKTKNMRIEDLK